MEAITHYLPNISISTFKFKLLYFSVIVALLFAHCEARKLTVLSQKTSRPITTNQNMKHLKIFEMAKSLNMLVDVSVKDTSIGSPFTLPPYDSLPPVPLAGPNTNPPYCVYPPPNPQSPSTTIPTPTGPTPTIPIVSPSPPIIFPGPPNYVPNPPPYYYEPSPPSGSIIPSPPEYVPSPIGFEPSPPVFEPPVVYPPPTGSPPTFGGGGRGHGRVWCVAKPTVPDPIIQEAMNYACGSGADCDPLQPNGSCFQPDTLLAHASYAFNSYWQRTKVAGGTCSFGGTAILVTLDPSSEGCHFESY